MLLFNLKDQEQDVETPDGRKVKTMLHLDGNRLIQKETWQDNSKEAIIVHEIKGDMWISVSQLYIEILLIIKTEKIKI